MPIITVTIDDTHEGYALFGELIVRYGRDAADFDLNGGYTLDQYQADLDDVSGIPDWIRGPSPVAEEADATPPHGIQRPTTTPTARGGEDIRDMIRQAVPCPTCNATTAWPCHSKAGQNYPDFIHQARIDKWNNQP